MLRFYHVRDAKLALVSKLLKRYAIARFCNVPWTRATATRDARTKPIFRLPSSQDQVSEGEVVVEPLLFNVSHQAGLVVFLAVHNPPAPGVALGVDVVCPSERRDRDHSMVAEDGWRRFVDMHAEVFSPGETAVLRGLLSSAARPKPEPDAVDKALRCFYALWCLREAYVKMTGEALLAPWLADLEMRGFAPPEDMDGRPYEAWFRGRRVDDVDVRLVPFLGDEYMVSTVVKRGEGGVTVEIGDFDNLDIEEVLEFGDKSRLT